MFLLNLKLKDGVLLGNKMSKVNFVFESLCSSSLIGFKDFLTRSPTTDIIVAIFISSLSPLISALVSQRLKRLSQEGHHLFHSLIKAN